MGLCTIIGFNLKGLVAAEFLALLLSPALMISYGLGETFGLLYWCTAIELPDEIRFSSIYFYDAEDEEEFELSSESESSELSPSIIKNFPIIA